MGMNLVTLMSNSVAVNLDHHSFFTTLHRLEQEFGTMSLNLVTFISNSTAVRLDYHSFHDALKTGTGVQHHGDEPGHGHG